MYPPDPGSVYHMTKVMDGMLFYYYNKNDRMRITDLHQGVVWGTETEDTALHPELVNRYDYDGDYGTVLNRFIMQGATGHPLTVYGTGEQVRAFIHIQNTVQCVRMAIEAPPERSRVHVFNQTTEQLRLMDLAQRIAQITGAEIRFYANPRVEAVSNALRLDNAQFLDLGLEPITLSDDQILKALEVVHRHKDRVNFKHIICTSTWRHDIEVDHKGVAGEFQQQAAGKAANG
jgi:UDP-sulfoquinovose synthase